ncbi:MAG: KH domain-containing protein [Niabella sp.]|nr:MAG: KH domain-containing protein [Niabella sp.]
MKELIEYIVKRIVNNPDQVEIQESIEDSFGRATKVFYIQTHPDDIKIVIGKEGRTIQSIRNIVKIRAVKDKEFVDVKIREPIIA